MGSVRFATRSAQGPLPFTRFSFTGAASGIALPSTVSCVACQTRWSSSNRVSRLVTATRRPSAACAVVLIAHFPPSLLQVASPNPPPE